MQKIDVIVYGELDNDKDLIEELHQWCESNGYEIRRGRQWNVVTKPTYTGADGEEKEGGEDVYLTHEIVAGDAVARNIERPGLLI